ncbi:MAG: preprotein translocase subunit SecE [Bacteroidales bacterium]
MSKIVNYVKCSYDELMHKVSWPTYAELQNSAVVVFVASLIIALVVFLMDMIGGAHPDMAWKGILGYIYSILS